MIPLIPDGADIPSIVSVMRELGSPYVPSQSQSQLIAGVDGQLVLSRCLDGTHPSHLTVERHSLLNLYRSLHSPLAFASLVNDWDPFWDRITKIPIAKCVRRCRLCTELDAKSGFVFARAIHQISAVKTCHTHRVALEEKCAACGAFFASRTGPMAATYDIQLRSCKICGCEDGVPLGHSPSEGYAVMYDAILRAVDRDAAEMSARQTVHIQEQFLTIRGSDSDPLRQEFAEFWGAPSLEAAAQLTGVSHVRLKGLIGGDQWSDLPMTNLVVVGFMKYKLRVAGIDYWGPFSCLDQKADDQTLQELLSLAQQFDCPSVYAIDTARGVPSDQLRVTAQALLAQAAEPLRVEIEVRRKARADALLGTKLSKGSSDSGALTENHRRDVLEALETLEADAPKIKGLRNTLKLRRPDLANWMLTNDVEWFDEHVPDESGERRRLFTAAHEVGLPSRAVRLLLHGMIYEAAADPEIGRPAIDALLDRLGSQWRRRFELSRRRVSAFYSSEKRIAQQIQMLKQRISECEESGRPLPTRNDKVWIFLKKSDPLLAEELLPSSLSNSWWQEAGVMPTVQAAREAVKKLGAPDAKSFRNLSYSLYTWMLENDRAWFKEHVPDRIRPPPPGRTAWWERRGLDTPSIEAARAACEESGAKTRQELRENFTALYEWSLGNDKPWLDETFPVAVLRPKRTWWGKRGIDETVEEARRLLLESQITTRKVLALKMSGVYSWMKVHDRDWLEATFPDQRACPQPRGPSKSVYEPPWWRRRGVVASVKEGRCAVLETGLTSRTELRRRDPGLYRWMKQHDAHWLFATCPDVSIIGRPEVSPL